jgi:hypothetical protein
MKVSGNADWLSITPDGVLMGKPGANAPPATEITVEASWQGSTLQRSFVIPVGPPDVCSGSGSGDQAFKWCEDGRPEEKDLSSWGPADTAGSSDPDGPPNCSTGDDTARPDKTCRVAFHPTEKTPDALNCPQVNSTDGCIVQFSRVRGKTGDFGHFVGNKVMWGTPMEDQTVIDAINSSKVFLSGSVLIRNDVPNCKFYSWTVVTQTVDSSNILFYGSSEASAFCKDHTVLIVLPAHAIWANVYGIPANVNDPSWKPLAPPNEHKCWTGEASSSKRRIRPCDKPYKNGGDEQAPPGDEDEKPNPVTGFLYQRWVAWLYNRMTQPGVSQGNISFAPIALGIKQTWDVQAYESTRLGPGWIGLPFMYEFDHTQRDNFNSLTAALMYDLRFDDQRQYWLGVGVGDCKTTTIRALPGKRPCSDSSPVLLVRPLEFSVRGGTEWAPALMKEKQGTGDLNLITGANLRLPIILNPIRQGSAKQPAQFTLVPVTGVEWGMRVDSHMISPGFNPSGTLRGAADQPSEILRWVAGWDASVRSPYNLTHNFLGDRPLTVDFSYRMRWLYLNEPFTNEADGIYASTSKVPELQFPGGRSYTRVTFIAPFSAYLQLRVNWQHGSLPPAFQFVSSEVTLGLSFSNPGSSEH